jgi:UDP:flavonoid glycosyltransferase YjiC (YdhE family)
VPKRILFNTFGSYGDVHPYLAIALELQRRGYQPVIATMEAYRDKVEALGIEFHPVRPSIGVTDVQRVFEHPMRGPEHLLRNILIPSLPDSYADVMEAAKGADIIVTHTCTYAGAIAAESLKLPWISTVLSPVAFFSAHESIVVPPMPLLQRLLTTSPAANGALIALVKYVSRMWARPIVRFRTELGLPRGGHPIFEGLHSPQCVLALFSRALAQPQRDWPANTHLTGFVFHDEIALGLEPALERFLVGGPPPVAFTLGSAVVHLDGDFYAIASRIAHRLGLRAVLLVGDNPSNLANVRLSNNVAAFEYAPFAKLFTRAQAVVHQGGIGTTAQALRAGRPTVVVPHAYDQPDTAARVERLGVARSVHKNALSEKTLEAALSDVLGDPRYAARAQDVAGIVRSEDGVATACDAIERHLALSTRPALQSQNLCLR